MAAVNATTVSVAIEEIATEFEGTRWEPDNEGGAYVAVDSIEIGERWKPELITLEFQILFNYPFAAIYPYYATAELRRADGGERPPALQQVNWRGRLLTQVSLRSNSWEPQNDTALSKLEQARHWFQTVEL
jgi:hypothetical protein